MKMIAIFVLLIGCTQQDNPISWVSDNKPTNIPSTIVAINDAKLQWKNGAWFYGGQPFSGHLVTKYASGQVKIDQSIVAGRKKV